MQNGCTALCPWSVVIFNLWRRGLSRAMKERAGYSRKLLLDISYQMNLITATGVISAIGRIPKPIRVRKVEICAAQSMHPPLIQGTFISW